MDKKIPNDDPPKSGGRPRKECIHGTNCSNIDCKHCQCEKLNCHEETTTHPHCSNNAYTKGNRRISMYD